MTAFTNGRRWQTILRSSLLLQAVLSKGCLCSLEHPSLSTTIYVSKHADPKSNLNAITTGAFIRNRGKNLSLHYEIQQCDDVPVFSSVSRVPRCGGNFDDSCSYPSPGGRFLATTTSGLVNGSNNYQGEITYAGGSVYYALGAINPESIVKVLLDTIVGATTVPKRRLFRGRHRKIMSGAIIRKDSTPSTVDKDELHHYVGKACVPDYIWNQLEGNELHLPHVMQSLAKTGLEVVGERSEISNWTPKKNTKEILEKITTHDSLQQQLETNVLVWTGRLDEGCYGSDLPCVKTRGIVGLSPKAFAELLMDSSKVPIYNKMSLGRTDEVYFQKGVDTPSEGGELPGLAGEAKIVKNRTQPPLSKKILEFTTFMYARKLNDDEGDGYIVVSRAVTPKKALESDDEAQKLRSEILLGVNLLQSIQGEPEKTLLTAVTHVNSPMVPKLAATTVGIKGAVDFINDIRALASDNYQASKKGVSEKNGQ